MITATVTSNGQITIPHEVRAALGIVPGSTIEFTKLDEDSYRITAMAGSVRAVKGALRPPDQRLTLDEMDEAIAAEGRVGDPDRFGGALATGNASSAEDTSG